MKNLLLIALILIILLLAFLIVMPGKSLPFVTIDGRTFTVDVAKTAEQQQQGLAIYTSLPKDKGMIFPFASPDYYAFWMKNMRFPIDIIYIRSGRVVDIFADVPAPKNINDQFPLYKPRSPADTVLEINADLSRQYDFRIGDKVTIHY